MHRIGLFFLQFYTLINAVKIAGIIMLETKWNCLISSLLHNGQCQNHPVCIHLYAKKPQRKYTDEIHTHFFTCRTICISTHRVNRSATKPSPVWQGSKPSLSLLQFHLNWQVSFPPSDWTLKKMQHMDNHCSFPLLFPSPSELSCTADCKRLIPSQIQVLHLFVSFLSAQSSGFKLLRHNATYDMMTDMTYSKVKNVHCIHKANLPKIN